MRALIAFLAVAGAVILSSCATIFTGTKQQMHFNSDPPGARIIVNGIERGKTPATIAINKPGFASTVVILRLEGYEDRSFVLDKTFNMVSLVNFVFLIPWVVDFISGAFMNYSPDGYDYALNKRAKAELKDKLDVDDIVLSSTLEKSANGLIVTPNGDAKKLAVIDESTGHVLVLQ